MRSSDRAFLVFAGLGSRHAERLRHDEGPHARRPVTRAVAAIGAIAVRYLAALPQVFALLMPLPDAGRVAISIGLLAPLAFAMGIPFPSGLARLASAGEAMVPWAWGINACTSVDAAILATLLAIHLGFSVVIGLAIELYAIAALAWR